MPTTIFCSGRVYVVPSDMVICAFSNDTGSLVKIEVQNATESELVIIVRSYSIGLATTLLLPWYGISWGLMKYIMPVSVFLDTNLFEIFCALTMLLHNRHKSVNRSIFIFIARIEKKERRILT